MAASSWISGDIQSGDHQKVIVNRYLQRNIFLGSMLALLVLIGLTLFVQLINELDDIGRGNYHFVQALKYVTLSTPSRIVEFLPLAVLLGCMLSLGSLASNSEIIAMQASGVSMSRLVLSVVQAAVVIALISLALSELIAPDSSTHAKALKNSAKKQNAPLHSREGVWIKDGSRVMHIEQLLPSGFALGVRVYQLGEEGELKSTLQAERADPTPYGWQLREVKILHLDPKQSRFESHEQVPYEGEVSHELLDALMIKPSRMSRRNLYAYLQFLDENRLDARQENLIFWQKLFAPFTIVVMSLLALPFVLGAQRKTGTGYRLMMGILLGLSFAVIERLLLQLGNQTEFNTVLIALTPNLIFLLLAFYLLRKSLFHLKLPGLRINPG